MARTKVYVHSVSVIKDGQRIAMPAGEYDVSETGIEDYEFSQEGDPKFRLTASEVGTYLQARGIVVREGILL